MSQPPMLEIQKGLSDSKDTIANLLPCRVYHTGSVDLAPDSWNPSISEDKTTTAYFRGRQLQGKTIALPEPCRGVMLKRKESDGALNRAAREEQEEGGDEISAKIGTMEVMAEFGKIVVWSHEDSANATTDPYLRSMEEWLQVADQIHSYENQDDQDEK